MRASSIIELVKIINIIYNWKETEVSIFFICDELLKRLGSYEIVDMWRWSKQWEVILSSRCDISHLLGFTRCNNLRRFLFLLNYLGPIILTSFSVCFVLVKVTREFEGPYNKDEPQFKFFLNLIIFRNKNKKIDPLFCSNLENKTLNLPFNWPRYYKSCQIALKHYTKTEHFACHTYSTDFSNFSCV